MFSKFKILILTIIMPTIFIYSCSTVNKHRSTVDKGCYYNERLMSDTKVFNVYFDFNSSELSLKEKTKLRTGLNVLEALPKDSCISLIGYTDTIGKSGYNMELSQKRAESVKSYLNEIGYSNVNIDISEGVGKSKLPMKCDDLGREDKINCLAKLRRVEVIVLYPSKRD